MVQVDAPQPLETPPSPAVESCKVCWTCRALITNTDDSSVKKHLQFCAHSNIVENDENVEHFVCDRSDYEVFRNVKRSLDKLGQDEKFMSRLQSILPQFFVKQLLDLKGSSFPSISKNFQKPAVLEGKINQNKPSYYVVTNKECQTDIEKAAPVVNDQIKSVQLIDKSLGLSENTNERSGTSNGEAALDNPVESPVPSAEENVKSNSSIDSGDELKLSRDSYQVANDGKIMFVCKLCSRKTSSAKQMLRHQRTHNDGGPFECKTCKFSTLWRKEWKIHSQQKHRSDKFLCHICASEFQTTTALDQHIVSSHPEINGRGPRHRLQCKHCDYVAREMASLKEHMRKHTGEKILCPHEGCKFTSFYARSLNKHLRQKHSTEKTQCCYICGFQTRHASSLTKHITLIHRDFKPYKCAKCSFTALYPSEIIAHARSKHLKLKRFACPKCPFKTSYQLAIQKHVARHNEPDGFACLVCGEVLSSRNKARKHMEKEHSSTHFQVVEEPSWEKVNANDYRIKDCDESSLDLNNIVVINNTQKSNKIKGAKKSQENAEYVKTNDTFELPENVLQVQASIEAPIEEGPLDIKVEAECVDVDGAFELPENILQPSNASQSRADVAGSLNQDSGVYNGARPSTPEGNPMLSGTTADFEDNENSLSSLFDLMSDFPRPSTLNRCQSASTLMFASLSPHLIDRPLTPNFFTESPSVASFFPNFSSKNLEADSLALGTEPAYDSSNVQQTLSAPSVANLSSQPNLFRNVNPTSPLTPTFLYSPQPGTGRSLGRVNLCPSLEQESSCMEVDSVFSQLDACAPDATANSAFAALEQNFTSDEIQAAVESIPLTEETSAIMDDASRILRQSPFSVRPNL